MADKIISSDKRKFGSIALIAGEILLIAFLLVVSIATMVTLGTIPANATGFLGFLLWLQTNTLWFFILVVLPLIALFLYNVYALIKTIYADKKKSEPALNKDEIMEEAKRQARAELLAEMEKEKKDGAK